MFYKSTEMTREKVKLQDISLLPLLKNTIKFIISTTIKLVIRICNYEQAS